MSTARKVIPISKRPLDVVFCILFVIFALIAIFLDSANVFAPHGVDEKWGITKQYAPSAVWPPQFFVKSVMWWCELADPLLCANPLWFRVMCFVSPFIYAPFYLVAAYAIVKGQEWIRVPILAVSSGLFYSLTVILIEQIWGRYASHNVPLVLAAYATYWALPIVLTVRFGVTSHPFTEEIATKTKIH